MRRARVAIERIAEGGAARGGLRVNTGFGRSREADFPAQIAELQRNLVDPTRRGGGAAPHRRRPGDDALRAAVLATGYSVPASRCASCSRHAGQAVHPVIPARGSVGASGDLAPLAHWR